MRGVLVALTVLVVGLGSRGAGAAPPTDEEIRAAAQRVAQRPGVQRRLPGAGGAAEGDPAGKHPHGTPLGEQELVPVPDSWKRVVGKVFLWGFAAAGAVVLLAWLLSELRLRRSGGNAPAVDPLLTPSAAPEVVRGPDPQGLAAAERWEEAVHALLLDALAALAVRRRFGDALTSREVLARLEMPAAARAPLGALVGHVELSVFGGVTADRAMFERALGEHQAFRASLAR